ncbi:NAD(P)-binding protein [Aaosphaeria arxii CBS 175.79]|uniref:NAD(P)-binding protein n=1 Tax=Aaosphaeria arxii CBS 175.79 TaxID=1450172 RepID=A0A6A5X8Q6_9PLEO|nr:NAD(P)-binding protein [Aaosphaeria arxii CBS 175.79]KAF2009279.1 NAD(P)-binding protein [Aaosphaeria arxii CBS 175.79]
MSSNNPESLSAAIRQSPPIDVTIPYEAGWVKGKTIVITGGASGFGASFARHWAINGATVVLGDINVEGGQQLARDLQNETGQSNAHFVHCDVTDWQSQVNFFKEAAKLSPHGGIDTVVANAGIAGADPVQSPRNMEAAEPQKPNFKIMDVNLTGVLYTTHLAYYWLPKNPGSEACSMESKPAERVRDRHLLLLGSVASLAPIVMQPQYAAAKHAVLGLFRSLRATSHPQGIRINLLCPYFIDTPIITTPARLALAGGAMGKPEDVLDAATRFVADSRILGRALVIGPKMHVKQGEDGQWSIVSKNVPGSEERAVWEAYADDWEEVDIFDRNFIKLINSVEAARGWAGWAFDIFKAVAYGFGYGQRRT